jgi:hypothetical protein
VTSTVNWLRRLGQNRLLDIGAVFIAVLSVWRIAVVLPSRMWDFDFNHFYVSSRLLILGQNPYLISLKPMSRNMGLEFSNDLPVPHYPPTFLWMFAPLAGRPLRVAFAVWVVVEFLSLGLLLWLTRHLLGDRLSLRGWGFICVAGIASQPVYWQFCFSQVQLPLAALVLGAYALHRRGQYVAACVSAAAAGMLKFYPFVLLPWFVWRSGGSVAARINRALLVAALCGTIVLVTGPRLWSDFIRLGIPVAAANEVGSNFHYSIPSFVTNLGLSSSGVAPSEAASRLWWAAGTAAGLVVIAIAYAICLRNERNDEMEFCLLCVAMLAGIVTVQGHYFVWLVFPLATVAVRLAARPSTSRILFFSTMVLLANEVTPPSPAFLGDHVYLKILANYVPLYGLVALGVFLGRGLARGRCPMQSGADSWEHS